MKYKVKLYSWDNMPKNWTEIEATNPNDVALQFYNLLTEFSTEDLIEVEYPDSKDYSLFKIIIDKKKLPDGTTSYTASAWLEQ